MELGNPVDLPSDICSF